MWVIMHFINSCSRRAKERESLFEKICNRDEILFGDVPTGNIWSCFRKASFCFQNLRQIESRLSDQEMGLGSKPLGTWKVCFGHTFGIYTIFLLDLSSNNQTDTFLNLPYGRGFYISLLSLQPWVAVCLWIRPCWFQPSAVLRDLIIFCPV